MSSESAGHEPIEFVVNQADAGSRLDVLLTQHLPQYSRVQLRSAIVSGGVTVDGKRAKVAYRVLAGQRVVAVPPEIQPAGAEPEDIPLDILFEDEHLAAINKPADMVVHPSRGHWSGTLASAAAFHFQQLSTAGGATRPGIVHRLDRDTSGVIVVAKTDQVHMALAAQFEDRTTEKEYLALVAHAPDRDRDMIDRPISIHSAQREKMAIGRDPRHSRPAQTFYEVRERFDGFAHLRLLPKTGRTHQIRVHLASIGCPVLCDRLYGGRAALTLGEVRRTGDETVLLARQALHALRLKLSHPVTGEPCEFMAPVPEDIEATLTELRAHRSRTTKK